MADWRDFRWKNRHLRLYVEDRTEEWDAARVYDVLPYKWQEEMQAEEQKRGRWRTVVKILVPKQQHQGLLQWINSWATAHYGFDTMKNALMLTTENRRMGHSLKAIDRVKCTTAMLKVRAIDPRVTADEIIDFISENMMLQHRNEALHHSRGGQENWQPQDVQQTDADVAERATLVKQDKPKGSGSASDATGATPQSPYPEVAVQVMEAILAEV